MTTTPRSKLTPWQSFDLVQGAARAAALVHRDDLRKGTVVPYLAHLWSVAALVLEHGGDDVQVAAAFLHDAVEDHGGRTRLDEVRERFGDEVADLVEALSDSLADTTAGEVKAPWKDRKARYLVHLAAAGPRVHLVSGCDKLHNARSLVSDLRAMGPVLWERFNQTDPAEQLWYQRRVVQVLTAGAAPRSLVEELAGTVEVLAALAAQDDPSLPARVDALLAD